MPCASASLPRVRCPSCGATEDRVVDSREVESGAAIRRRRECGSCGSRFTTFERCGEASVLVIKRSGAREPFDREKVLSGIKAACKNRPVTERDFEALAAFVEVKDGTIVVVGIPGDEATVKTLRRRGGRVVLVPSNPDFAEIDLSFEEVTIYGQVVTVLRKL